MSVNLDSGTWDRVSSTIMEHLIKLSFKQNGPARQRLLNTRNATLTHTQDTSKWKTEFPRILMKVRDELRTQGDNTTNQNNNRSNNTLKINRNEYTDEFRRVQEAGRKMSKKETSEYHRGETKELDVPAKQRLARVYGRLLSRGSSSSMGRRSLKGKDNNFNVIQVNGTLFHDIFEANRRYLRNGELVDIHDNYDGYKCFVTDDGLCGFAIAPDGNLVSVFSLWGSDKPGFLYSIKDFVKE